MISKIYSQIIYARLLVNKTRENSFSVWSNLIVSAVVITGLAAIPACKGLWHLWHSDTNFEGLMLVPAMYGLMLYKSREDFISCIPRPTKKALYVLPATLGIMISTSHCGFPRIAGLLLVVNLLIISLGIWGRPNYKLFVGPLLFLILMVPPPTVVIDFITITLQKLFSLMTEIVLLCCSGTFIERWGPVFWFEELSHPFIIAPECSGIRSLQGFIVVASFYCIFDRHSIFTASLMISGGIAIALMLNFIRIIMTMWMGLSGLEKYSVGFWHGLLGIVIFAFGCKILSGLSSCLYSVILKDDEEQK